MFTISQHTIKFFVLFLAILTTSLACYTSDLPNNFFTNATSTPPPGLRVSQPPENLPGSYTYQRQYSDGQTEEGTLKISEFDKGYRLEWINNDSIESGLALLKDRILGVGIGQGCSLAYYIQYDNYIFKGLWMGEDGLISQETVSPYFGLVLEKQISREYYVSGIYDHDRSKYSGSLAVNRLPSEVYDLIREVDDVYRLYGLGLVKDDKLISVYGQDNCKVLFYEIQPEGALEGIFAMYGDLKDTPFYFYSTREIGKETAQKN
ncbi:MAG: hypothetical protein LWX83_00605 [Anaerolineae bacterium]|nr:hypothetical protein [Anaerolineae bacterium]